MCDAVHEVGETKDPSRRAAQISRRCRADLLSKCPHRLLRSSVSAICKAAPAQYKQAQKRDGGKLKSTSKISTEASQKRQTTDSGLVERDWVCLTSSGR